MVLQPSLIREAFSMEASLIPHFIDLCNAEGSDELARALLRQSSDSVRYPFCRDELPNLRSVSVQGSMQIDIEVTSGIALDCVLQELQAPEAQALLLAVANLHFQHRCGLTPVLLELRSEKCRNPPPRVASITILTIQHRNVDLHTLGRITKCTSSFLMRKDKDEWASEQPCWLVNADRDAGINACIDLIPTFGETVANTLCSKLGDFEKCVASDGSLRPAANIQTVLTLFAWSIPAQVNGGEYVIRLFGANGLKVEMGPVIYL